MEFRKSSDKYVIRLKKGESLIDSLLDFCLTNNIKGAFFTGIGALLQAELGYFDTETKTYEFKPIEKNLEITNVTGNIASLNGELMVHAHATLSDRNLHVYGGHLKSGIVGGTCEILLVPTEALKRRDDEETGLKLLDLAEE